MICELCKKEMIEGGGCSKLISVSNDGGKTMKKRTRHTGNSFNCHDCGAAPGQIHHFGCDMEICPFCSWQALICKCKNIQYYEEYREIKKGHLKAF
jgi:hypothetical protein